jgi:ComF family protein
MGMGGDGRYVCAKCVEQLIAIDQRSCEICGKPLFEGVMFEGICLDCREADFYFQKGRSAFLLKGVGQRLIHELKYRKGWYLKADFMTILKKMDSFLGFYRGATLVPVPLHTQRKRERGFNQSEWIASLLSSINPDSVVKNILERTKKTLSQTGLEREERCKNVEGAFRLKPGENIDKEQPYCLVDDVYTTGATLNACAKVLAIRGAKSISVITLGRSMYGILQ